MHALADYLEQEAGDAPLIIAGDFNDWRNHAGDHLAARLGLDEAFTGRQGQPVRSFPAAMPMFRLDRIYIRGLTVRLAHAHHGRHSGRLSDHVALSALLVRAV